MLGRRNFFMVCLLAMTPMFVSAADPPGNAATLSGDSLDQIWLAPTKPTSSTSRWYPQPIQTYQVQVIDFDAKQLTYAVTNPAAYDDHNVTVAADRVLWIEPGGLPEGQSTMIRLFDDGEFGKSLSYLPDVLKARPPVWRQQWLTMMSACAAHRSGRAKIALDLVDQLDRRPLPPIVIAWLPIQWKGGASPAAIEEEASRRIDDDSPLVQLVAASWLLSSPERRVAVTKLLALTRNRDRPSVARLAQVLLWTTKPPTEVIESESKWLDQLDSLPMVLQAGPTIALERKLRAAGQVDSANRLLWSTQVTPIQRLLFESR